jgi:hypothetical protein
MQKNEQDARTDAEVIEADSRTSLEQMISLLQGGEGPTLADPGLTRLDTGQLESLRRHASHQAALCLERATQLLRLMLYSVENSRDLQPDDLAVNADHVMMLVEEQRRWMTLAENARYYQQHPDAAERGLRFGEVKPMEAASME